MSEQKDLEEEVDRISELLNKAILEHFHERVVPLAKSYVEAFETGLSEFNCTDDEIGWIKCPLSLKENIKSWSLGCLMNLIKKYLM